MRYATKYQSHFLCITLYHTNKICEEALRLRRSLQRRQPVEAEEPIEGASEPIYKTLEPSDTVGGDEPQANEETETNLTVPHPSKGGESSETQ